MSKKNLILAFSMIYTVISATEKSDSLKLSTTQALMRDALTVIRKLEASIDQKDVRIAILEAKVQKIRKYVSCKVREHKKREPLFEKYLDYYILLSSKAGKNKKIKKLTYADLRKLVKRDPFNDAWWQQQNPADLNVRISVENTRVLMVQRAMKFKATEGSTLYKNNMLTYAEFVGAR